MTYSKEEIEKCIADVLKEQFGMSEELLISENWTKPLTGRLYRFSAVDLIYLLFELEAKFGLQVPPAKSFTN